MQSFEVFFAVCMKLLNKQSNCQWLCDVIGGPSQLPTGGPGWVGWGWGLGLGYSLYDGWYVCAAVLTPFFDHPGTKLDLFSSTNTKTIFWVQILTKFDLFGPKIPFSPRSFWVQFSVAHGTHPAIFGPSTISWMWWWSSQDCYSNQFPCRPLPSSGNLAQTQW